VEPDISLILQGEDGGKVLELKVSQSAEDLKEEEQEEGEIQRMEGAKEEEWDCEEGGEGILARLHAEEGEIRYPYNCIALICSVFYNNDQSVERIFGVGTLIDSNLMVTCAHIVNYKFRSKSGDRVIANSVMIICDRSLTPRTSSSPRSTATKAIPTGESSTSPFSCLNRVLT
jgi:hypothetical protein